MKPSDLKRPYDGSTPLFKIGLFPFPASEWIEIDDNLGSYLEEKDSLLANQRNMVFVEEPDTGAAQREVLNLVAGHLQKYYPRTYETVENTIHIRSLGRQICLDSSGIADLIKASLLAQDDFVLMRRNVQGWRLVAGCVCFPSSWDLQEKFGKPLQVIHGPVPEFGPGTRNAGVIERIFDSLQVGKPVKRMNWSIYADDVLFHNLRSEVHKKREHGEISTDNGFVRMETQTLTKLEQSGDVLFTIRIHIEPMRVLQALEDRSRVCKGFAGLLERLDSDQLAYKGLTGLRDNLALELRDIANTKIAESP